MAMISRKNDINDIYHTQNQAWYRVIMISWTKSYEMYMISYTKNYENSARNGSAMILDMILSMISYWKYDIFNIIYDIMYDIILFGTISFAQGMGKLWYHIWYHGFSMISWIISYMISYMILSYYIWYHIRYYVLWKHIWYHIWYHDSAFADTVTVSEDCEFVWGTVSLCEV